MAIEPMYIAIAGGVAGVALLFWIWRRRGARPKPGKIDAQLERDLRRGNYEQAGQRELSAGNLEAALELFLRAQRVGKAAHIAEQLGRLQEAAELFELSGDKQRAAILYRKLGLPRRADELWAASAGGAQGAPGQGQAAAPLAPTLPPSPDAAKPFVAAAATGAQPLTFSSAPAATATAIHGPRERALALEEQIKDLFRRVKGGEPEARLMLPDVAHQAAEAWMSAGDLTRAAQVCRAAGLIEQAVNLYANLLGEPAAAAQILVENGELRRAAELFELANQYDKALDAWLGWCRDAADPLEHVAAVSRLGGNAVERLGDAILRARPLSPQTADLHQRVGDTLLRYGAHEAALAVFERLLQEAPNAAGVGERVAHARGLVRDGRPAGAQPAAQAEPPRVVVPRGRAAAPAELQLRSDDLERLAAEVAERAVRRVAATMGGASQVAARPVVSRGLEKSDLALAFANDPAVLDARNGPSTGELNAMIGGRDCDLINIEVYYRLGLAHVAAGRWEEARRAFAIVEDTSRGYRDAKRRVEEIARWQAAVGMTHAAQLAGAAGAAAIGRYTLQGELGRGGMAVVYRARDDALGREVALKFIAEGLGGDERMRALFEREARSVASLNHPNIVTVYDVGVLEGRPFICMELVEGHTIEQQLEVEARLKILDALRVAEQVLAALEYAHDRKIMHRDVKPANMMRTKRGLVKLMDFGLAKSTESRATTVISGTPAYMAPEQMIGKNVDGRADIYAVGASLHQMISGHLAFDSLRRDHAPPPLTAFHPGVPRMLEWAVQRALEFEPDARFSKAGEMRDVLLEILQAATEHAKQRAGLSQVGA